MAAVGISFVKIGEVWVNMFEIVSVHPNNAVSHRGSRVELSNGTTVYSSKDPKDLVKELWDDEERYTYLL